MPSPEHQRLRLSTEDLAILCALHAEPGHALLDRPDSRVAVARLQAEGALDADGTLREPAATIARVVARPALRLEARVWSDDGIGEHRGWADERDAVVGDAPPGATRLDLAAIDLERLPLALAFRLKLAKLGEVPPSEPLPAPRRYGISPEALEQARDRLRAGDEDGARAILGEHSATEDDAALALRLARTLRAGWTLSASWHREDGSSWASALVALDAGDEGWWRVEPDPEYAGLVRTTAEALWERLGDLLPA